MVSFVLSYEDLPGVSGLIGALATLNSANFPLQEEGPYFISQGICEMRKAQEALLCALNAATNIAIPAGVYDRLLPQTTCFSIKQEPLRLAQGARLIL